MPRPTSQTLLATNLSSAEKSKLEAAAQFLGMSLSDLFRFASVEKARAILQNPPERKPELERSTYSFNIERDHKALVRQAAELLGQTEDQFARTAALEKAKTQKARKSTVHRDAA